MRTVGDGVVEFAGVQNGYGNVVFVKHPNQHVTVYAHLSRIDVRQSIEQARRWAPWVPPAGPPVRTCTASSASTASTRTR